MKHRHQGKYKSKSCKGTIFKKKPVHKHRGSSILSKGLHVKTGVIVSKDIKKDNSGNLVVTPEDIEKTEYGNQLRGQRTEDGWWELNPPSHSQIQSRIQTHMKHGDSLKEALKEKDVSQMIQERKLAKQVTKVREDIRSKALEKGASDNLYEKAFSSLRKKESAVLNRKRTNLMTDKEWEKAMDNLDKEDEKEYKRYMENLKIGRKIKTYLFD